MNSVQEFVKKWGLKMPSHFEIKRLKKLFLILLFGLSVAGATACYPKHAEVALNYHYPGSNSYYYDYYPYPYYYYDHYYGPFYYFPSYSYPRGYRYNYSWRYYNPGYSYPGHPFSSPSAPSPGGRTIR
jgi:hypothetical protein